MKSLNEQFLVYISYAFDLYALKTYDCMVCVYVCQCLSACWLCISSLFHIQFLWHFISFFLSWTFLNIWNGFDKPNSSASWVSYLSSSLSFFVLLPIGPLFCLCVSLSFLKHLALAPTFCPVLVCFSSCSSMHRLSLWQICAITRTLWTIARLSIKGVISPQWPTPWQEWVPPPRSLSCPAGPAPSVTFTTASSARPARRPSKGSRYMGWKQN